MNPLSSTYAMLYVSVIFVGLWGVHDSVKACVEMIGIRLEGHHDSG